MKEHEIPLSRWSTALRDRVENPAIVDFIRDVIAVYEKHGMSISHEDCHGAFVIEPLTQLNIEWLCDATDDVTGKKITSPGSQ